MTSEAFNRRRGRLCRRRRLRQPRRRPRRRRQRVIPVLTAAPSARLRRRGALPGRHGRRGDARVRFCVRWTGFPRGIGPGRRAGCSRRGGEQNPALVDACTTSPWRTMAPPSAAVCSKASWVRTRKWANPFAHAEEKRAFDEFGVREAQLDGDGGRTRRLRRRRRRGCSRRLRGRRVAPRWPQPSRCVAARHRRRRRRRARRRESTLPVTHRGSAGDGVDSPTVDDDNSTDSTEVDTIRAAAGPRRRLRRKPRGPWTEDDIVAAESACAAIRRPWARAGLGGGRADGGIEAREVGGSSGYSRRRRSRASLCGEVAPDASRGCGFDSSRGRTAAATFFNGQPGRRRGRERRRRRAPRRDAPRRDGEGARAAASMASGSMARGGVFASRQLAHARGAVPRVVRGRGRGGGLGGAQRARLDAVVRWLPATLPAAIGDGDEKG